MDIRMDLHNQLQVHPEMACMGWNWENKPKDIKPREWANVTYKCRICGKEFLIPRVGPPENRGRNSASEHGEECIRGAERLMEGFEG